MRDGDEKRFGSSTGNRIALCGVAVLVKSTNKKTNKKKSVSLVSSIQHSAGRALGVLALVEVVGSMPCAFAVKSKGCRFAARTPSTWAMGQI